ncbi:phytanoyl-CoA hydroxylase [Klebsormidium nitens]|uniref:Phytanoyl-CoA hydroxylase n=1 Tax=Klebsormidium nitens TaxID=105231 RepID=A0A1Y1HY66_KLENI|nr:phytanoyl-CoA hydroxylase [Klebsormidium nitens]|eukprot:GAQ81477.1 phytanoyl-CoA hydroxylase [Klebsormidium nitens]
MGKRIGGDYVCDDEDRGKFEADGYVHLSGVLSPEEIADIEKEYMKFIDRQILVEGRDFCDMSGDYSKPLSEFSIVNIMLPRKYHPTLKDNVYEKKAASIAAQLCGPDMVLDYDQLLAKPPGKADGIFGWHQDLAYWPITPDTTTASFWLAIDDSRTENGCIRFVPGTHLERELRKHAPPFGDRDKSHLLTAELQEGDRVVPAEIKRGDVTVHHERILHGSGPNTSQSSWRRAYVMAFRRKSTVEEERRRGFTHSHNDKMEVLTSVGEGYNS